MAYKDHKCASPLMDALTFFMEYGLTNSDAVVFAKAFQVFLATVGPNSCWNLHKMRHSAFSGFQTGTGRIIRYQGFDARPLLLAAAGRYSWSDKTVLVRHRTCQVDRCLNPSHYYWGTRADVAYERGRALDKIPRQDLIETIKAADSSVTSKSLSERLNIPYHLLTRIRSGRSFEDLQLYSPSASLRRDFGELERFFNQVMKACPEEARRYQVDYHVTNELECPWHRKGEKAHKGNFGHMGECLDCLEEMKKGRCAVDVTLFDYRWYWQVRRFWDQVDVKGEDECWPWLGGTKKGGSESVAYCPSPFHSSKSQSAMRVAFWLSRGYTGKHRISTQSTCEKFCCNPKHLTAQGLEDVNTPFKIDTIQLNYGNIFEHFKKANGQAGDGGSEQLSP